jgi:hypothetical protein
MNLNDEQGFLSDKFEDWSGEPIPNGWNDIEAKLGHKDRGKRFFWIFFPAILMAAAFAYLGSRPDPVGLVASKETQSVPSLATPSNTTKSGAARSPMASSGSQSFEKVASVETDATVSSGISSNQPTENTISGTSSHTETAEVQKGTKRSSDPSNIVIASGSRIRTRHSPLSARNEGSRTNRSSDQQLVAGPVGGGTRTITRIRDRHSTLSTSPSAGADQDNTRTSSSTSGSPETGLESAQNNLQQAKQDLAFLSGKNTILVLALEQLGRPQEVPMPETLPLGIVPEKKPMAGAYFYSFGLQSGIATNRIQLRHSETQYQLKLRNPDAIQSGLVSVSGRFHYKALSWLETYAAVQLGVFRQVLDFDNKSRTPSTYNVSYAGSGNSYQADPIWQTRHERLSQTLVFTSTEIGVRPQLFNSASGPFAGMVIWTRLFQSSKSSLGEGSSFGSSAASIAFGYRAGYRLAFSNIWFLEGSVAGLPNELLPQTPGLQVVPTLYSLSLNRKF